MSDLGTNFTNFYQNLMVFVAENFTVTKSNVSHEHTLWCKPCGNAEIAEFGSGIVPGELEMMREIGKHLDETPHDGVMKWAGSNAARRYNERDRTREDLASSSNEA